MYSDILIPTDGSRAIREAVEHGLNIAEKYNATVHTLYVVDLRISYHGVFQDHLLEKLEKEGEKAVGEIEERAESRGLKTKKEVVTGIPYEEILDYSENHGIDMIAMGTHGRTGIGRLIIGSTTENVVRHSSVPVMTVRMDKEYGLSSNGV
ncbi:MAG: universal stress protein [Candidatus Nanohaloarchaea archaeon]|nr:universal stress protein [Candidatus Nanohaloarchaea archaeon]